MRSPIVVFAGLLGAAVIAACSRQGPTPGAAGASAAATAPPAGSIEVTITCTPTGRVIANVSDWRHHAQPGDTVNWHLVQASNTQSVTVAPKNAATWPMQSGSINVPNNGNGSSTVLTTADTGSYPYNITGTCRASNDSTFNVTIDPDVVVD